MEIKLSHLIVILQTYDPNQVISIEDIDERDGSTYIELSFDSPQVPHGDLVKKLNLLKEPNL